MVVRAVAHCVSYVQTLFNQGRSEKGGSRTGVEFRRTHVACVFTRDGTRINTVTGTIFLPREVATMWVDSTTSAPYAAWDSRFTFHAAPPPPPTLRRSLRRSRTHMLAPYRLGQAPGAATYGTPVASSSVRGPSGSCTGLESYRFCIRIIIYTRVKVPTLQVARSARKEF